MFQKVILAGNLGRDPEMRYMPDGTAVTNLSLAVNRTWTDRATGQKAQETTWFRVAVWGAQAEACNQYLHKGSQVLVEGRLKPDPATGGPKMFTRQDGTVGATFELHAESVRFLGGGRDDDGDGFGGGSARSHGAPQATPAQEEDDLPF